MRLFHKRLNYVTSVGLLCLILAPLACEVRRIETRFQPPGGIHWSARIIPTEQDDSVPEIAYVEWNPPAAATVQMQIYNERTGRWELSFSSEIEAGKGHGAAVLDFRREKHRIHLLVTDGSVEAKKMSSYLDINLSPGGEQKRVNNVIEPRSSRHSTLLFKNAENSPTSAMQFNGGIYEVFATKVDFSDGAKIHFTNAKNENKDFKWFLTARKMSGELNVDIGPFDPEKDAPDILINAAKADDFKLNLIAVGRQHPKQRVRVNLDGKWQEFKDGKLVDYPKFSKLFRFNTFNNAEYLLMTPSGDRIVFKPSDLKFWTNGTIFGEFDLENYDPITWDDRVPIHLEKLGEVFDLIFAIESGWENLMKFRFADMDYRGKEMFTQNLIPILKEFRDRSRELGWELFINGVERIIITTDVSEKSRAKSRDDVIDLIIADHGRPFPDNFWEEMIQQVKAERARMIFRD